MIPDCSPPHKIDLTPSGAQARVVPLIPEGQGDHNLSAGTNLAVDVDLAIVVLDDPIIGGQTKSHLDALTCGVEVNSPYNCSWVCSWAKSESFAAVTHCRQS